MTSSSLPSCNELAAQLRRFRDEEVNPAACSTLQAEELDQVSSTPPTDLTVCKDGSRSLVGRHALADGTECVLKYYRPKNLAKKVNYRLRGSRAMRSWVSARAFALLGIPTPAAMMIVERPGCCRLTLEESFLACHLAPGISLSAVKDEEILQHAATQLHRAFQTMAAYRISHGDLKANNIIVSNDGEIRFIDLDGTTILSQNKRWTTLWEHDRNRFLRNWPHETTAHRIFSDAMPLP